MSGLSKLKIIVGFALTMQCLISFSQEIDIRPVCKKYDKQPLFMQNGQEIVRSCAELIAIAKQFSLSATTFAKARNSFKSSANLNMRDANESDFPTWMSCRIDRSNTKLKISCALTMYDSNVMMVYDGGPSGIIEKLTLTLENTHAIFNPMIDGLNEKRNMTALPAFSDLLLDIVIAKNNVIAPPEETYSRSGKSLKVTILNVYL